VVLDLASVDDRYTRDRRGVLEDLVRVELRDGADRRRAAQKLPERARAHAREELVGGDEGEPASIPNSAERALEEEHVQVDAAVGGTEARAVGLLGPRSETSRRDVRRVADDEVKAALRSDGVQVLGEEEVALVDVAGEEGGVDRLGSDELRCDLADRLPG